MTPNDWCVLRVVLVPTLATKPKIFVTWLSLNRSAGMDRTDQSDFKRGYYWAKAECPILLPNNMAGKTITEKWGRSVEFIRTVVSHLDNLRCSCNSKPLNVMCPTFWNLIIGEIQQSGPSVPICTALWLIFSTSVILSDDRRFDGDRMEQRSVTSKYSEARKPNPPINPIVDGILAGPLAY